MATRDYFNRIHRKIVQNTGASVALRNQNELNSFLNRVRSDIANLTDYVNSIVYPIFQGPGMENSKESILCWGPKWEYDAVLDGLAATTLQTFPEEHGGGPYAPECYWFDDGLGGGRPRSIKETFDCLMAMISEQQVLIQEKEPDLTDIREQLACLAADDQRIIKDAFGCNYKLTCSDTYTKDWPIGKHLYEIFRQVIVGHGSLSELGIADPDPLNGVADPNVCSGTTYPDLYLQVPQSQVLPDVCIEQWKICSICDPTGWNNGAGTTLKDDLINILDFIGSSYDPVNELYCAGMPVFNNCLFSHIEGYSLTEAIDSLAEEICKKCEDSWGIISNDADGGTATGPSLTAEGCSDELTFVAGPGIEIATSSNPDKIKISGNYPTSILGNLNDAYRFEGNPAVDLGKIQLHRDYEDSSNIPNSGYVPGVSPYQHGAGIAIYDDETELKSKLFQVNKFDNYPGGYFSVGSHWGLGVLEQELASGNISQSTYDEVARPWLARKIVHTEESLFYMQRIANYENSIYLPSTAGLNDNGSINPETGLANPLAPHEVSMPYEGAVWISEGQNPNWPTTEILDACGKPLEKSHLYYRMPGNGAVYKLSSCGDGGGGNLQDAYDFDKDSDGQSDGGRILLRGNTEVQNRTFWLMQASNFVTQGLAEDYWPTPIGTGFYESTSGAASDPKCPYYVPWFAITDNLHSSNPDNPTYGPVGLDDGVKGVGVMDRFFSVQYRDQCPVEPADNNECCCELDDEGNVLNPGNEYLYDWGGTDNIKSIGECSGNYSLGCLIDPTTGYPQKGIGWIKQTGIINNTRDNYYYETGDCYFLWFNIPPQDPGSGASTEKVPVCFKVGQEGFLWLQIDSNCTCDINGETYVLLKDMSENSNANPLRDHRVDLSCLNCCCDFDEETNVFMSPLWKLYEDNSSVGNSTLPVRSQEMMVAGSAIAYDPNNTGSPTHYLPPENTNAGCYWDAAADGLNFGGATLLGSPVDVNGSPITSNGFGHFLLMYSEDQLSDAGLNPGDTFNYSEDDCSYISVDIAPNSPEIDATMWMCFKALQAIEIAISNCYWTNNHLIANGLAPVFLDENGNQAAGNKRFYAACGPDIFISTLGSGPNDTPYWEALPFPCTWMTVQAMQYLDQGDSGSQQRSLNTQSTEADAISYMAVSTTNSSEEFPAAVEAALISKLSLDKSSFANQVQINEKTRILLAEAAHNRVAFSKSIEANVEAHSFATTGRGTIYDVVADDSLQRSIMSSAARKDLTDQGYTGTLGSAASPTYRVAQQNAQHSTSESFNGGDSCDVFIKAETVQDYFDSKKGTFNIYYKAGNLNRALCAVGITTNDLGVDFTSPGNPSASLIAGDALTAGWNPGSSNLNSSGSDAWVVSCGSPCNSLLTPPPAYQLLASYEIETTDGSDLNSASNIPVRMCQVLVEGDSTSYSTAFKSTGKVSASKTATKVASRSTPISASYCDLDSYCCAPGESAPPSGDDIYFSVAARPGEVGGHLELWFNAPENGAMHPGGLSEFEVVIDCSTVVDQVGNPIDVSCIEAGDIQGGEAFNKGWNLSVDLLDPATGSTLPAGQFRIKGDYDNGNYQCIDPGTNASTPCIPDYNNPTSSHTLLAFVVPGLMQGCFNGVEDSDPQAQPGLAYCSACACVQEVDCPSGYEIPTSCCPFGAEQGSLIVGSDLAFKPIPADIVTLGSGNYATTFEIWMSRLHPTVSWNEIGKVEFVIDTTCLVDNNGPVQPPIQLAQLIGGKVFDCNWEVSLELLSSTQVKVTAFAGENAACCIDVPEYVAEPCGSDTAGKALLAKFAMPAYLPNVDLNCQINFPVLSQCEACSFCGEPVVVDCPEGSRLLNTFCCDFSENIINENWLSGFNYAAWSQAVGGANGTTPLGEIRTQLNPVAGAVIPGPYDAYVFKDGLAVPPSTGEARWLEYNDLLYGSTKVEFMWAQGEFELGSLNPGLDMDMPDVSENEDFKLQYATTQDGGATFDTWVDVWVKDPDLTQEGNAYGWFEESKGILNPGSPYKIRWVQERHDLTTDHWAITNIRISNIPNVTDDLVFTPDEFFDAYSQSNPVTGGTPKSVAKVYYGPNSDPATYDKLQKVEFVFNSHGYVDINGNPIKCWDTSNGNILIENIPGASAIPATWTVSLTEYGSSGYQILITAEASSTAECISTGNPSDPACSSTNELISLQFIAAASGGTIDIYGIGEPNDNSYLASTLSECNACECATASPTCILGICCIEEDTPSNPEDCSKWPSVHFWQSPAYFTCMPKGWAPNTCENEGVVWVGSKNSDTSSEGFGEDCTIYYREPSNGQVHDLTLGSSNSGGLQRFSSFSAGSIQNGCIDPAPITYSAGINDMFKLYAMDDIELVTEDSPELPGGENAVGIRLCFEQNYPRAATRTSVSHFKYSFDIASETHNKNCVDNVVPVGKPLLALYSPDDYSSEPSWRGLSMAQSGLTTSVDMIYSTEESKDLQGSCLTFRKLRGVSSSSTTSPLEVRVGQWGDAEIIFNANAVPLESLKNVSSENKKDGDTIVWDSEKNEFRPSSIKHFDIMQLQPRNIFPDKLDVCDRGTVVYIENSEAGIDSGFYVFNGSDWTEWILF